MITAIVLAAGFSRRFGEEKLLKKIHDKPVIRYVVDTVTNCGFDEIILVYHNEEVKNAINNANIRCVLNKNSIDGMSTSVKCGIKKASETDAYMFINSDQPFLSIDVIHDLIDAFQKGLGSIIVPKYNGKRGNPTLFSAKWKDELLSVTGDKGGREIIVNHPEEVYYLDIKQERLGMDMDTREDYNVLKEWMGNA